MLQNKKIENDHLMSLINSGCILNIELALQLAKSQNITINLTKYTKLYRWLSYLVEEQFIDTPLLMFQEILSLEVLDYNLSQLKKIPTSIEFLSNLKILILSLNQLRTLPRTIGNLSRLESLYLNFNQLKKIPTELKKLQQLKKLRLNNNYIQKFPKPILSLVNLEHLDLSCNQIKELPLNIHQLYKLKQFNLSGNPISTLPQQIGSLTELKQLTLPSHLKNNKATFDIIKQLTHTQVIFSDSVEYPLSLKNSDY
ncbi:leucine-rich repeat domain-containing protein [Aureispira sp. CCB-QB1]|uniref:leucine-rich repeat domain-containing protein n=1 Tax=Aureispira sp. CCB-QB1 TaxID=1313421 RepID=UPI00069852E7|nr:leucine-rich repeat domain-containing protein [Aureispira sp. CCB-QB1]